ncbi:MAG: hypothetical protein LBD41_04990 [Clostridiales Family XIII bacterium]|jgi:hypothetical protein|nr:hypothetical protein [Clostridiales Family XIII bacterium]
MISPRAIDELHDKVSHFYEFYEEMKISRVSREQVLIMLGDIKKDLENILEDDI